VDTEPVIPAKGAPELVFGNAITVIAPALVPGVMLGPPAVRAVLLPGDPLLACWTAIRFLRRPVGLLLLSLPGGLVLLLALLSLPILLLLSLPLLSLPGGLVLLLALLSLPILLLLGLLLLSLP